MSVCLRRDLEKKQGEMRTAENCWRLALLRTIPLNCRRPQTSLRWLALLLLHDSDWQLMGWWLQTQNCADQLAGHHWSEAMENQKWILLVRSRSSCVKTALVALSGSPAPIILLKAQERRSKLPLLTRPHMMTVGRRRPLAFGGKRLQTQWPFCSLPWNIPNDVWLPGQHVRIQAFHLAVCNYPT